jgi:hypothetical protein
MAKGISDEILKRHAQQKFDQSRDWRDDKILSRWKKSNNLYDGVFEQDTKDKSEVLVGQGRLFIPKTYSHIQRMLVDILESLFFDSEEVCSVTSWKSVPSASREIIKTLLNYRLSGQPINFYAEAYEACLDALRNKVGIFKVYPIFKKHKEILDNENKDVVDAFQPCIECVPYEDVYFSPESTWKDYHKHTIIHRMRKSLDHLKRRGYKNLEDLKDDTGGIQDEIKDQRERDQGSPFRTYYSSDKDIEDPKVYIYEIWTHLDINGDGLLESCVYTMAGDAAGPKRIIKGVEENDLPYKHEGDDYNRPPFIVGHAYPESHKMYGKDIPEIVEGLQRETNAQRNQRREAVALSLRRPILANRNSGIDLMSLVNRRIGGVVLADDVSPSSIREMDVQGVGSDTVQEQNVTAQDFFETTSIPPNLLGMPTSRDETATAVTSHMANANKKIEMTIRNLSYTLFTPAFKFLLRLEQAYETDAFIELVTGRKLGWLFTDDNTPPRAFIQGDLEVTANAGVNKQIQLNKWFLLMDRANQANMTVAQMVMQGVVNPQEVKFFDPMAFMDKILPILGEKYTTEFKIQAQQPQPPQGGQGVPGIASQPRQLGNIEAVVSNMNPQGVMGGNNGAF